MVQRAMGEATLDLPATALPVVNPFRLTLRPALLADIGALMAIERSPDYERYVARSEAEEHCAMLSSPSHAYWLGVGECGAGSEIRTPTFTSNASRSHAPARAWALRF